MALLHTRQPYQEHMCLRAVYSAHMMNLLVSPLDGATGQEKQLFDPTLPTQHLVRQQSHWTWMHNALFKNKTNKTLDLVASLVRSVSLQFGIRCNLSFPL